MFLINTLGLLCVLLTVATVVIEICERVAYDKVDDEKEVAGAPVTADKPAKGGDPLMLFRNVEVKNGTAKGQIEVHFINGDIKEYNTFHFKDSKHIMLDDETHKKSDILMVIDV